MIDQMGRWFPDYPGQHPWQDPNYMRMAGQQIQPGGSHAPGQQAMNQQMMTPPTIDAKIIQVDSLAAMDQHALAPGTSQMFMTKDDKHIAIRSMYANGQHSDDIYDKRPPAPPAPTLNPDDYVRRDEVPELVAQAIQAQAAQRKAPAKKEEVA